MVYKRKRSVSAPGSSKKARYSRRSTARRYPMRRRRRFKRRSMNPRTSYTQKSAMFKGVGFPKSLVMSLPYRTYKKMVTQSSGSSDYNSFRINGLYDPDVSLGGSQPLYYDQVTAVAATGLYDRYLVYKVDIEVKFRNQTTDNDVQAWAVCDFVDNGAGWTNNQIFNYGERPKWTVRQLEATNTGGPLSHYTYKKTVHMADIFGITKTKLYADAAYAADYDTHPTQSAYLTIGVCDNPSETLPNLPCDVEVYLLYHVKFFKNLQAPPQS